MHAMVGSLGAGGRLGEPVFDFLDVGGKTSGRLLSVEHVGLQRRPAERSPRHAASWAAAPPSHVKGWIAGVGAAGTVFGAQGLANPSWGGSVALFSA